MERNSEPAHILIIRFSSLGDVAMMVPVVYSLAKNYPKLRITVLSRDYVRPLFACLAPNVHFMGVDLDGEYHGMNGLGRLFNRLAAKRFTMVADLHDVLRSKYLRMRLQMEGEQVEHIDKERVERRRLTDHHHHDLTPMTSAFDKYADVFARLQYPVKLQFTSIFGKGKGNLSSLPFALEKNSNEQWIGIAPFAAHQGKVYPMDLMEQVLAALAGNGKRIFLFGSGTKESSLLTTWERKYPNVKNMVGKMRNMTDDLVLMSHLDVMVSMDSANMHLASLVNIPVVSIWGATHPSAGFMGWHQKLQNVVSVELPCRPCSIYGSKKCMRGDHLCLYSIVPSVIVEKVLQILQGDEKRMESCANQPAYEVHDASILNA